MPPHRLLVLACLLGAACGARGARPRPDAARPGDLPPAEAPGGVALGGLSARVSPCRGLPADADAQGRGYMRRLELQDSATTLPRWTRDVTLDVDSAGQPRRLCAFAVLPGMPGTPGTFNPFGPADRVDVVVAFLAADGRIERGLLLSRGMEEPTPHHYYTGDPLPASLHAAAWRLARVVRDRCAR